MAAAPERRRVVILGAAGRDFHNFNVVFRDDPAYEVVAFTAALAGARYPQGIPIAGEDELDALCRRQAVDLVVFAYSDVTHA